MSVLKIITEDYAQAGDDVRLLQYIYRKSHYTGGLAVDPQYAAEQMEYCRYYWGQNIGAKLYHFIVAFSWKESKERSGAGYLASIAYDICAHFSEEYQIVFAVHHKQEEYLSGDKESWHIHFVMNPVSYRTGKRYPKKRKDDYALRMALETATDTKTIIYY